MQGITSTSVRRALRAAVLFAALMSLTANTQAQRGQRGRTDDSASVAEAELQKGIALTQSGKFQEAIPHYLAAQGQVANEFAASFNLALCYVATGQFKPAIDTLNDLRAHGQTNADLENLYAQALLGNRQPTEALAAAERAAKMAPKNEKLYVLIVEACMDNGYNDVGLKIVEMGLEHLPKSARLAFEHAMLLVELDQLDEAKQELQKVTGLARGSDVAYIAQAQKDMFDGNAADAKRAAREGIEKGNQHPMLLALYGEAVIQAGVQPTDSEFADAQAALERAISVRPNYASAQISLGKLYLMEGRVDDAIARLNAGRQLDPRNPAAYSNLAAAFRKKGDTQQAEEMLAILAKLNQEQIEKTRSAPGDRKKSYQGHGQI
jgi:tetratricopeptide (TPR) repeat protein